MWLMWIILGLAALIALLVVGFLATIFVTALIETHHVQELIPLDDDAAPSSAKARQFDADARKAGLLFLGVFRDSESALLKTKVSIYLSEDGIVMMLLPSIARIHGYRLYSRMADDVWIETGEVTGNADMSRCRESEMLPDCNLRQVMAFHRDRIAAYKDEAVSFNPETLVQDFHAHDHARADDVIGRGLGRWVDAAQTRWRHNFRGACRQIASVIHGHAQLVKANERAKRYKALSDADPVDAPDQTGRPA